MSGASGMTDERAALMLELLGTIVQRFDGVEERLDTMAKVASTPPPAPKKAAQPQTDKTEAFTAKVSEAAARSVQSAMDKHMVKLEADLRRDLTQASIQFAGRDMKPTKDLIQATESMIREMRDYGYLVLWGAVAIGIAVGGLATWIGIRMLA